MVKNAACDDSSEDEEAFADAMDKLPQTSSDDLMALPKDNPERDEVPEDDEKEDPIDQATRLRTEVEERLSPEQLKTMRVEALDLKTDANNLYVSNEFQEAVDVYTKALDKCPLKFNQDRSVLFSNRAAAKLKMVSNFVVHRLYFFSRPRFAAKVYSVTVRHKY